jgi:hypothetical protein
MKQKPEQKGKQASYRLGRRGFVIVAGPYALTTDMDPEKQVTKMRTMHNDSTFEGEMASTIGQLVCAYQGCRKQFIPTRAWQRFCCLYCKDAHWNEIRREVRQEIMRRRQKGANDNRRD